MYYLGIDLGGTKIAAGLVDINGEIIHKDCVNTYRDREPNEIIKDMASLSKKVIKDSGLTVSDVKSIGVGSPGILNSKEGTVIYSCNIGFNNTPLRSEMQKYIDLPIYMDNDANCAALAEAVAGAAKDVENSVMITIGTGIGGGIIINRKLYSGFNYAGGELGHIVIVVDGEQCNCGRKGCWEAYASAPALIKQTIKAAEKNQDSILNSPIYRDSLMAEAKTVFDAMKSGDKVAKEVIQKYIIYLSEGITNIVNIFQPEVIVIGGGVSKAGEALLGPLREHVARESYNKEGLKRTQIREAKMGNEAGIIGAAMLGC